MPHQWCDGLPVFEVNPALQGLVSELWSIVQIWTILSGLAG